MTDPAAPTPEVDTAAMRARHTAAPAVATGFPPDPARPNVSANGSPFFRCTRCNAASVDGVASCDTIRALDALDAARSEVARLTAALADATHWRDIRASQVKILKGQRDAERAEIIRLTERLPEWVSDIVVECDAARAETAAVREELAAALEAEKRQHSERMYEKQRAWTAEADLAKARTRLEIEQRRPEVDVLRDQLAAARAAIGRAGVDALTAAADAADGMHDPPAPDCHEWAEWLRARARAALSPPAPTATAVVPFCPRGCTSHHASDHQGACGHCGSGEDELCDPGCPVDGPPAAGSPAPPAATCPSCDRSFADRPAPYCGLIAHRDAHIAAGGGTADQLAARCTCADGDDDDGNCPRCADVGAFHLTGCPDRHHAACPAAGGTADPAAAHAYDPGPIAGCMYPLATTTGPVRLCGRPEAEHAAVAGTADEKPAPAADAHEFVPEPYGLNKGCARRGPDGGYCCLLSEDEHVACMFCQIVRRESFAQIVAAWPDALAFVPLNPVTPGHVLVVPRRHVAHAGADPAVTGAAYARAAEYARDYGGDFNLITSAGPAATQTVGHLHVHIVPRREGDDLPLPWTPRQATGGARTTEPEPAAGEAPPNVKALHYAGDHSRCWPGADCRRAAAGSAAPTTEVARLNVARLALSEASAAVAQARADLADRDVVYCEALNGLHCAIDAVVYGSERGGGTE